MVSDAQERASWLADHPEDREYSPVEELLAEWHPELDEDEIRRCADMMRQAAATEARQEGDQ